MLKEIRAHRKLELIATAREHGLCDAQVEFPPWYMQRWHVLPEGYFSARSIRLYDRVLRHIYNIGMERNVLDRVVEDVLRERPSRVVEVGCGPGRFLEALTAKTQAHSTGVDLSPFMLGAASRRRPGVELLHADARHVPVESGTFDVVVAVHLLGHVPHDIADSIVSEAARLLRSGGKLVALDHSWHRVPDLAGRFETVGARKMLAGLQTMSVWQRIATVR